MVTVPHKMVGLERMLDYRVTLSILYFNMGTVPHKMVGLERMSEYSGFTVCYKSHFVIRQPL